MDTISESGDDFAMVIDAPLAAVWHVLAHQFDRVGEWASPIPYSHPAVEAADLGGCTAAPVPNRVCGTTLVGFGTVTETIVSYSEDDHTFTYVGAGLPAWIGGAENTWFAESIDPRTTRVGFRPRIEPAGFLGKLMLPLFDVKMRRMGRHVLEDLRHYVETGQPSPRKRRRGRPRGATATVR